MIKREKLPVTLVEKILSSKNRENVLLSSFLTLIGIGYFLAGTSSFYNVSYLPFSECKIISFIPQGIIMVFYGTLGIFLGVFINLSTLCFKVGLGVNVYNQTREKLIVSRKLFPSFPRKETKLCCVVSFFEVVSLRVSLTYGKEGRLRPCKKGGNVVALSEEGDKYSICYLKGSKLVRYLTEVILKKQFFISKFMSFFYVSLLEE